MAEQAISKGWLNNGIRWDTVWSLGTCFIGAIVPFIQDQVAVCHLVICRYGRWLVSIN